MRFHPAEPTSVGSSTFVANLGPHTYQVVEHEPNRVSVFHFGPAGSGSCRCLGRGLSSRWVAEALCDCHARKHGFQGMAWR